MMTLALVGLTVTETGGGRIVTVADALLVESAELTAVTVTVLGVGTDAGVVKSPDVEIVPVEGAPPTTAFTSQVTTVFMVPDTVAANCEVAPT